MKRTLALALLQACCVTATLTDVGSGRVRIHPRSLPFNKRDGRDCGKFEMFCEKAAGACNNACYHINCIDKNTETMVFDAGNTNDKNRLQSGCRTDDGSVCNKLPFSQKLRDPVNSTPGDLTAANCDEWPMATTKQDDFLDGNIRNSLRCIVGSENFSAGSQLNNWMKGTNANGPKKTCDGDIKDGDHWTISFNLDNVDKSNVNHCDRPGQTCDSDPFQFHMTKKTQHLDHPYKPDEHNRYSIGKNQPDLYQCRVVAHLHGTVLEATVYNNAGDNKGSAGKEGMKKNDVLEVKGLPLPLAIIYNEDDANPLSFNYGAKEFFETDLLQFFFWTSDQKGVSKQFQDDGSYCERKDKGTEHVFGCYFPCPAE
ncbi:MAG: hypothetical protein Q9209_007484 [Squamulea sp. 1 TL-2023]